MKKSKAILMALCAVLLVAASVMGTLAYLTSTDTVTNTFTVGKVAITLDEAKVDPDGTPVQGAARVNANKYHLLPGHTYKKDPTIHVAADSEDCYLFVKVENGIADIEAATTIADQMTAKGWEAVAGKSGVYVYTNKTSEPFAVTHGSNVPVFEEFTILGTVTNDQLAGGAVDPSIPDGVTTPNYGEAEVIVTAYAVQADGFANKTAAEIWTAASFT